MPRPLAKPRQVPKSCDSLFLPRGTEELKKRRSGLSETTKPQQRAASDKAATAPGAAPKSMEPEVTPQGTDKEVGVEGHAPQSAEAVLSEQHSIIPSFML